MTHMTNIQARFQLDYGDFKLDVDLKLPGTGITVLFGHSGSGKTTLLRCIAGLQRAPQGFLGNQRQYLAGQRTRPVSAHA